MTLSARFGIYVATIDITVSSAKFDRVVQLDADTLSLDMCQSLDITPIARYLDDDGNDEIRPVDSIIINTITWLIRNQEDDSDSRRAHIDTTDNQATLHSLASGNIIIQAQAFSVENGIDITSVDFDQEIGSVLNSIKLCQSSADDLSSCGLSSARNYRWLVVISNNH